MAGYPLCKGNVMASNPTFAFRSRVEGEDGGMAPQFDPSLARRLDLLRFPAPCTATDALPASSRVASRAHADQRQFPPADAENALQAKPPLAGGAIRTRRRRRFANHQSKLYGVRPFVDTAHHGARPGLRYGTAERCARRVSPAMPREEPKRRGVLYFVRRSVASQAALESLTEATANRIDPDRSMSSTAVR